MSLFIGYWRYVSQKAKSDGWGQRVVEQLSVFIVSQNPLKQFYETYEPLPKLSALLTELQSSQNLFKDSYVFEFLGLPEDHKE